KVLQRLTTEQRQLEVSVRPVVPNEGVGLCLVAARIFELEDRGLQLPTHARLVGRNSGERDGRRVPVKRTAERLDAGRERGEVVDEGPELVRLGLRQRPDKPLPLHRGLLVRGGG